jgi:hypothetical protein
MLVMVWASNSVRQNGDEMTRRGLRGRCEALARTVPIPDPFDVSTLIAEVSRLRGRPIQLLPFPLPAGAPCGVCIATDQADYIVVTDAATGTQRDHIALHELAHLLLEHSLQALTDGQATRRILPHLDPTVVRTMFARTNYSTTQEREAETLASLIRRRAGLWRPEEPARPATGSGAAVLARIEDCLRYKR